MIHIKNAVITGATKGIGKAIAMKLAAEGLDLFLCSRNQSDLERVQEEIQMAFPAVQIWTMTVDLSKRNEVQDFVQFISDHCTALGVLVNNAGVFFPGKITEEKEGTLTTQMETNLYSAYHLTRGLLPLMRPQRHGYIFNMCSIASFMAYPNGGSYSISKFALLGFTKVLRAELLDEGIKVTAIMPGATWSNSWAGADLPVERLMQPEDVAEVIVSALNMSDAAVMEEIVLRPQKGDL